MSAIMNRGLKLVNEAVEADNAKEYQLALDKYRLAMETLMMALKHEKNPSTRSVVQARMPGYMQRAEELKQFIIDHPDGATPRVAKGGGAGKAADVPQHDAVEGIDLETALSKIIGLEQVKLELQDLEAEIRFNTMRADRGIEGVEKAHAPHMQFLGNPGTGKTMVGKLLGKLLKGIGIVEKGHLVEVKREDLVAMHIGETAQLTKAKIEEAKGGVLFIDEAYQLMPKDSTRDFGKEAVETIMNALHDNDPVFIFAGYPADMERFINANAGLTRRVGRKFNFPDYTPHDIAQIFCKFKLGSFQLEGPKKQWIRQTAALITEKTSDAQLAMYNGGLTDAMLDHGCAILNRRLRGVDPTSAGFDQALMTITFEDLSQALDRVPQPPAIEDDELGDASAAAKSAYKLVGTAMKQGNAAAAMVHLRSLEAALRL